MTTTESTPTAAAAPMTELLAGGAYDPVQAEETITALRVTGTIPEYLDGRYVRNGPNPIGPVDAATFHYFMGDGMVHGVRLRGGRAEWYRNRWVRSTDSAKALGEPAPASSGVSVAANTTVIQHAGATLALVEAGGSAYALTDELETVGVWNFQGTLPGGYTAHPKLDRATGELHAISYRFDRPGRVQYSVVDPRGRARRVVDVPVHGSPMVHDMGLTQGHVVVLDLPIEFDLGRAMRAVGVPPRIIGPATRVASRMIGRVPMNGRLADLAASRLRNGDMPYSWAPQHPSRLGVLPREGSGVNVRWFEIDQCFIFHVLGAYDEVDEDGRVRAVIVDGVRYDSVFDDDAHGPEGLTTRLARWRLDLVTGKATDSTVDDRPQEFPRIDERLLGNVYRYGYATGLAPDTGFIDGRIVRYDFQTGQATWHSLGSRVEVGELVFVPSGPDAAEDDGVLMGFVHDGETGADRLELLDAATLESVAQVHLPVRVPHGFHGNWLPS
ncbi:carotenoid oxygenase family protein [uncultured Amnibacterium sp.]|uniref:carotenoid oxygenase family protein n=1 Tax=uncultured Amnibacterium sp. TaxID=1631851 RepID=UPI0035CC2930